MEPTKLTLETHQAPLSLMYIVYIK